LSGEEPLFFRLFHERNLNMTADGSRGSRLTVARSIVVLLSLMDAAEEPIPVTAEVCPSGGPPSMPGASSPDQPDSEVDPHLEVDSSWLKTRTSSGGRELTSSVWVYIKELSDDCPKKGEYTHLCTFPRKDGGGQCNCYLKLGHNKALKKFTSSNGVIHMLNAHPESRAGKEAAARRGVLQDKADHVMESAGNANATPHLDKFFLNKYEKAITFQASLAHPVS
jgi:hypothetical protein